MFESINSLVFCVSMIHILSSVCPCFAWQNQIDVYSYVSVGQNVNRIYNALGIHQSWYLYASMPFGK